jgi:hypothetical protein
MSKKQSNPRPKQIGASKPMPPPPPPKAVRVSEYSFTCSAAGKISNKVKRTYWKKV